MPVRNSRGSSWAFACPHCRQNIKLNVDLSAQINEVVDDAYRNALQTSGGGRDIALIRACLHPDRPDRSPERLTKAFQAFDRLLKRAQPSLDDDIPF